jgi:hypothetical protein
MEVVKGVPRLVCPVPRVLGVRKPWVQKHGGINELVNILSVIGELVKRGSAAKNSLQR